MGFSSPFKRGQQAGPASADAADGDGIVIDAEASEIVDEAETMPVRRAASVPESAAPRAVELRSERDMAVRNVAVATAGGLVAGAATIAVAAVAKTAAKHATAPTPGLSRRRRRDIASSQSYLIDVHTLKPGR